MSDELIIINENHIEKMSNELIIIDESHIEKILNGDYEIFDLYHDFSKTESDKLEHQIIIDIMNDRDYEEKWIKWCNNTETDCRLLRFILWYNYPVLPIIPDYDKLLLKNFEDITFYVFDFLVVKVDDFNKIIHLYELMKNKERDYHWKFIERKEFDKYLRFSERYVFNPFDEINNRKKVNNHVLSRHSDYLNYELFKDEEKDINFKISANLFNIYAILLTKNAFATCKLNQTIEITNNIKRHINEIISIDNKELFTMILSFIGAGIINEVIDMFEDEIDRIMKTDAIKFIKEATIYSNIKLIDYLMKYDDFINEINYCIIVHSNSETVCNYFPDFTQDKLDELIRKIEK